MERKRDAAWIVLAIVLIGLGVFLWRCADPAAAQDLAPIGGRLPAAPALVGFHSRVQTSERVTYVYELAPIGTVTRLTIDGPCLLDTGGVAVRYNDSEQITLLETGFARGLDGAKITIKYAPTLYTVVGFWVSAEYPGGLAANSRWALFPLDAYTEGNPTPYTQIVPQCDASPTVLPLVTSGPAEPGFFISAGIVIVLILILHSNRRPTPPRR